MVHSLSKWSLSRTDRKIKLFVIVLTCVALYMTYNHIWHLLYTAEIPDHELANAGLFGQSSDLAYAAALRTIRVCPATMNSRASSSSSSFSPLGSTSSSSALAPKYFMVAVLNTCDDKGNRRRDIIRQYLRRVHSDIVDVRFLLDSTMYGVQSNLLGVLAGATDINCKERLQEEQEKYGDLWFFDTKAEEQGPRRLIFKVEKMFHHVVLNHAGQYRYIFKTDDDSLADFGLYKKYLVDHVDSLFIKALREKCSNSIDLDKELSSRDLQEYMSRALMSYGGTMLYQSKVHYQYKVMSNEQYIRDTGQKFYTKYAAGAGYVVSMAVANAFYTMSQAAEMRKWRSEDSTVGHWVSTIDHIPFQTYQVSFSQCCQNRTPSLLYHPIKDTNKLSKMADALAKKDFQTACKIYTPKRSDCP